MTLTKALRQHVEILTIDIGPRTAFGGDGLDRAARYIHGCLEDAGLEVGEEAYDYRGRRVANLIATPPGAAGASAYYLVGAHYDTAPATPGADDNASAVAVIHRVKARLADGSRVEYHVLRGGMGSCFWKSTDPAKVGSPEYLAAYQKAARPPADEEKFGSVIDAYFDSGEFRDKSPRTKKDYLRWGNEVRKKFATAPKSAIESPKIRQIAMKRRDQWDGRNADYAWTVLSLIVSWAYEAGKLQQHHLRRGKKRYKVNRAEIIRTEFEVQKIEATAPEYVARALRVAVETGLRPGDLIRLAKGHIQATAAGRRIQTRTNKRGRLATIPVTRAMAEIIDFTPADQMLLLVNDHGEQLSEGWISKALKRAREAAGLRSALRLYDARGACVTRLVIAGATLSEIAHHMGWGLGTAAKMIETYAAMDPDLSDSVLVKLDQIRNKIAK